MASSCNGCSVEALLFVEKTVETSTDSSAVVAVPPLFRRGLERGVGRLALQFLVFARCNQICALRMPMLQQSDALACAFHRSKVLIVRLMKWQYQDCIVYYILYMVH